MPRRNENAGTRPDAPQHEAADRLYRELRAEWREHHYPHRPIRTT